MSKIVFIGKPDIVYDVKFDQIGEHQVRLIFDDVTPKTETLLSGFNLVNEHNGEVQTERPTYIYIYRTYDDIPNQIELCDDNVQWVAPPEPEPEPEPKPPTEEELKALFERNKGIKVAESKAALASYLEGNPLKSSCHGGKEAYYNVTSDKQTLMTSNYLTYTIEKSAGIGSPVLTWNATGEPCEEWTEQEYLQLILETSAYVKPLVTKQQYYEVEINSCLTQEDLDKIVIDYSSVHNGELDADITS